MQQLVGPDEKVLPGDLEVSKETQAAIQTCIEFERGDIQTGLAESIMIYRIMISRSKGHKMNGHRNVSTIRMARVCFVSSEELKSSITPGISRSGQHFAVS